MNVLQTIASWWGGFFDKRLWSPVGGRVTTSLESVSEDTALNYSAVWCATRLLCGTAASLPLPIFRGLNGDERTRDRKHPVYRLLNQSPNPEMTANAFRSIMWQWQVNWGNAYAEIQRTSDDPEGQIHALWPIHPDRVKVMRDKDDAALYYEVREEGSARTVDVDPWRIWHIPSILTQDGIHGMGVIEHARESIGAGIAAEKYGAHWFGGAAVPRAVVKHDGMWNEEARDAFRKEWDEIYSGPDGHRVALLQRGADITTLSISNEDSQFLETRQFSVEEIARWYGVPPHMLQHLLRATFNNIEHLGINFVQYSLIPWMRVWEQCIWKSLFTEQEQEQEAYFAEHNVDALMRGDSAARASFYQTMTNAALMTRNEVRKLENLDPVEGGDTFLVQGAMVPLDEDGKPSSEFATPSDQNLSIPQGAGEDEGEDEGEDVMVSIKGRVERILNRDLSRILTKETKRVSSYANKPDKFCGLVDSFYSEHATFMTDALVESLGAIGDCGISIEASSFVSAWVSEGKSAIMEAAGRSRPEELREAVRLVVESNTWIERPLRAIQGISESTVVEAAA